MPDKALDELIGRIAESETFRMAPMMRTLLLYLWKRQGEAISEYAIAVDALGRPPDFDPKTDSTVRVQIARLRAKLKDFYDTAGDFPLKLSIPRGRHELTVVSIPVTPPQERSVPAPLPYLVAGILTILLLAGLSLFLYARVQPGPSLPPLPRLWRTFAAGGKPSLVVVPSPLYFYWPERGTYIRDLAISEYPNWQKSPVLRDLAKKWGPPELAQTYVGAMEMATGVKLLQYLDKRTPGAQLVESRKFSIDAVAANNIVFLGMPRTTAGYLDRLLSKTSFYMAQADPDIIRNRHPKQGEPAEFRETSYSADRRMYPATIVFLPQRPEGTRCLLLLGRYLTGAATMLLSVEGLKLVEDAWVKGGSPDAWEMVVEAEIYRDTLLKTRPVAFRPIASNFWDDPREESR